MEIKKFTNEEIQNKINKLKKDQKTKLNFIKKIMFDNMDQKIISMDNIKFNIITNLILFVKLKMDISISIFDIWKKEYEKIQKKK